MNPDFGYLRRADFEVRPVDQATAAGLVEAWHYAKGGPNTGVHRHGLFRRGSDECLGVAWWLPPTKVAAESVSREWFTVLALTRLVIAPDMPTNAASFLLGASIRLIRREGRWRTLLTYADEGQGHTGAIYLATNWRLVDRRLGDPVWKDASGKQVSRKCASKSRTAAEMASLGYTNTGRTFKRKYVINLENA